MRNFILIDHSIIDNAGHHLEYAKRVLFAAKQQGFRTILGINRAAEKIELVEADCIVPAFTGDFWSYNKLDPSRILQCLFLGKLLGATNAYGFCSDLEKFLDRIQASKSDIIFVPTLGALELVGIVRWIRRNRSNSPFWHVLFRRDMEVSGCLDVATSLRRSQIRLSLKACKEIESGLMFFYTDTDQLSTQYTGLGAFEFSTLPIPVDTGITKQNPYNGGRPLVISYLGDAREEKGFHVIPGLIARMRAAGFDANKVRFRIQMDVAASYSTKRLFQAKTILTNLVDDGLDLVEGPFDSKTYTDLLITSDVILLPYRCKSYKNRSSGILVEALAAGIPVVYPKKSWGGRARGQSSPIGFYSIDEIQAVLKEIFFNYEEYESQSQQQAIFWRQVHCASRLIDMLKTNGS